MVAYDGDQTSFTRLQQRLGVATPSPEQVAKYPVVYCVFDLLEVDGEDLTDRPFVERRARLTTTIRSSPALQHTEAWHDDAPGAVRRGVPGRLGGAHREARRRTVRRGALEGLVEAEVCLGEGFVIGGYTDPTGSRTDFGALSSVYEQAALRYAGKVGTGYTKTTLRDLGLRLRKLETAESAFVDARPIPRGTHWTQPALVAQIGFAEWTKTPGCASRAFWGSTTIRARLRSSESVPSKLGGRRSAASGDEQASRPDRRPWRACAIPGPPSREGSGVEGEGLALLPLLARFPLVWVIPLLDLVRQLRLILLRARANLCRRRGPDRDAVPGSRGRLRQAELDHAMFETRLSTFDVHSAGRVNR